MPARQRGFARKRGNAWLAGWYADGRQVARGGFATKTLALDYANAKADEAVAHKAALKFGDEIASTSNIATVNELVGAFLARHDADPATIKKLRSQLGHARRAFGDRHVATLTPVELDVWRATLPERSRHYIFRAFKQALEYGVAMNVIDTNPTGRIRNRRAAVDRRQIHPFDAWEQVETICEELDPRYAAIPTVLVGCGLRPEELFGLDRRDLDLEAGVLTVERVFSQGMLKDCKKSSRQRRRVPLRGRVVDAIAAMPPRIDTPVLFPAPRGGRIDLEKFRARSWAPALRAAGVAHRRVYDCRHTFASWAIAGGISLFHLSKIMGTSTTMIGDVYGHLLPDSENYLRGLLDAYDERPAAAAT
jgi:integrase